MDNGWSGGQYSIFRALLGAYLFTHFAQLLPSGTELFSSAGMLGHAADSPLLKLFPNILGITDSPAAVSVLIGSGALAALAFAAGWRDRAAALWIWYVLACLFGRNPMIQNPSLPYVGWMLLAHQFIPAAPYGSWAARGRSDPGGGWSMPRGIFLAGWIVMALSYSYSGYTKVLSSSWAQGDMLGYVLQNPLARDWALRDFVLALPPIVLHAITLAILWVELLYALLALSSRLRPLAWSLMLLVQLGFALLLNFADLTLAMLLFHLFTFDPLWIRTSTATRVQRVYYDGNCALCHGAVRFLIAEDQGGLRYAPLQGSPYAAMLQESFVALTVDGRVLTRSTAAIALLAQLGGLWRLLSWLLRVIPRPLRDRAYDFVGRHRMAWFGPAPQHCPLLPAHLRNRVEMHETPQCAA